MIIVRMPGRFGRINVNSPNRVFLNKALQPGSVHLNPRRAPFSAHGAHNGSGWSDFRSRIGAHLRPAGRARRKTQRISPKKWRNTAPNGACPRVQSAISPCSELTVLDRKPPSCQTLRLWSPVAQSRLRPAKSATKRHSSHDRHEPTCVSTARFDDCADFAGRIGKPARAVQDTEVAASRRRCLGVPCPSPA
jgi:hypothetical protein